MTFTAKLKLLFSRDARNLYAVKEFAHANKDLLIIVCDPKTDRMFATYRDRYVNGRIKSQDGKTSHVIKNVLKYSLFQKSIDQYLAALMETLHLPTWRANQFYQMIDGFIYAIAKGLRKKREEPTPSQPIKSPFVNK